MRSLMLAAALALTSLVAQPAADACGGYYGPRAPQVFLVGVHGANNFVLLNQDVDVNAHAWQLLDPDSFDRTELAAAPALATPVKLTLLGEQGAKVVRTSTQTLIKEGLTPSHRSKRAMPSSSLRKTEPSLSEASP